MSALVTEALFERLKHPVIDFNKGSSEWHSENGGRAVFTLVDLPANDNTVIPHNSVLYVAGASGTNGQVNKIILIDIQNGKTPRLVTVAVEDVGSKWDWNQGDGKTQVVSLQLLKACSDFCIAAFETPDEQKKKEFLLSLYRNLKWAIGIEFDDPIVKYARDKWDSSNRPVGTGRVGDGY